MQTRKRTSMLWLSGGAIALFAGSLVLLTSIRQNDTASRPPAEQGFVSTRQLISLKPLTAGRTPIVSGSFTGRAPLRLFYALQDTQTRKLVSGGTVAVAKDGAFSRNIALPAHVARTHLQIKVYAQDKKGKVVDELATKLPN